MRDITDTAALRERVIRALIEANAKLRPGAPKVLPSTPCSDLWDDQLELIELLMEIDAKEFGPELAWQKAQPRAAYANDLVDWIVKELTRETHVG